MEGLSQSEPADRSLSLVIPAYNEEAGIRQAVEEADQALARLATHYEIIVVDDGSSDGTAEVVQEAAVDRPHIRLLRHQSNLGYSAALRTGFEATVYERVAFTDADCQFYLADLASLLALSEHHPVAVGFRLDRKDLWSRRFFSWGYNVLVRTLLGTGVRDCDCALKVFRRDALMKLLPETPGFFVNTEMLARARQLGYFVAEAGVRHRPRLRGASKVSLGDIPRTLATLLPFWWTKVIFPGPVQSVKSEATTDASIPVICYPHGWDSVSFSVRRDDVRVYHAAERQALIADLRSRPKTLVFVKSERYLREFERALPAGLEFVPRGRQGNVTAGVVQRRHEVPSTVFAQR